MSRSSWANGSTLPHGAPVTTDLTSCGRRLLRYWPTGLSGKRCWKTRKYRQWGRKRRREKTLYPSAEDLRRYCTHESLTILGCKAPGAGPSWRHKRPGHGPPRYENRCTQQKLRGWQASNHRRKVGSPRGVQDSDGCRDRAVRGKLTEAMEGIVLQE